MTFPAAQGSENKADTLWPLVTYPLPLYSVGQKATSPPGFTRRGRRAPTPDERRVQELVTMFENHPNPKTSESVGPFPSPSTDYWLSQGRTRKMVFKAGEDLSREACDFCYRSL